MLIRRLNGAALIVLVAASLGLAPAAIAQIAQTPPEAPNAAAASGGVASRSLPPPQLTAKTPGGAGVRLGEPPLPGQRLPASPRPPRAIAVQAGLSQLDKDFLIRAAQGGMMQTELGKVAASRGKDPQIKQYAMLAAQNAGKAEAKIDAMAAEFGVSMSHRPPENVVKLRQELVVENGRVVDQEYIRQILPANAVAVNLFNSEAHGGRNPVLLQFARQMLPQFQKRQQRLLRLTRDMGGLVAGAEPNPPMKPPKQQPPQHPASKATAIRQG